MIRTAKIPEIIPRREGETSTQKRIIAFLLSRGWMSVRVNGGGTNYGGKSFVWNYIVTTCFGCISKGHADLVAYKGGKAIFIECKVGKNGLSDAQKKFRRQVEYYGMPYCEGRSVEGVEEFLQNFPET